MYILTSPKFEFRECKLTFLDDVEAAKLMHQENPLEIGILFMSENIIYIKCVTASSIYGRELAIHENQAKGLKAEKNGGRRVESRSKDIHDTMESFRFFA